MMWIVFEQNFDFTPSADRRVTIAYRAGPEPQNVTRECCAAAVAAGKAKRVKAPARRVPG